MVANESSADIAGRRLGRVGPAADTVVWDDERGSGTSSCCLVFVLVCVRCGRGVPARILPV